MENLINFADLCELFEKIKGAPKAEKFIIICSFFAMCRSLYQKDSMFSILRSMVPKLDRERESYNMKESKIARVLIKMLALPPGNDKNILTKAYSLSAQTADFGDVVYSVVRKYLSNRKTTLSVDDVNNGLDSISKRTNEAEAEDILLNLFKRSSAEHCKWIIRIILKSLKLGIDDNRILNCYHKDGATYFASNISLRKTAEVLYDPNINVHELNIQIFEAFRPMLSKRVDAAVFKKQLIDNKLFYVENKFDGERFQLHMVGGSFKYFSRNGFDYTQQYGSTFEDTNGVYTSKLKNVFQSGVKNVILDGEMMLWNTHTQRYGSKGMELDVKKLRESGIYQPCFCVYDILLLNGEILTNKPLKERVNRLKQHVLKEERPGIIILSEIIQVFSRQEIVDQLNTAVDHAEEGIIVKDPESVYKYSDRNSGWYKMKLEYFQDTMIDMDLLLMGGQFTSHTSDRLNSFIVGVRSGCTDTGSPIYLSIGKVSSGLKDDQIDMLNRKLKSEGRIFENQKDMSLLFGKEIPNYYIEPGKSLVLVVRATELVRSNDQSYKTSYTLRFPRVLAIRNDKPPDECLNMNELLELTGKNKSVIKLNKRNITLEEIINTKTRRVKKKKIEVVKFEDTRQIADLFENYVFHVLNEGQGKSRDDIEGMIRKAGGRVIYKVDSTVDIVLVSDYNEKAKLLCTKRSHYDVISVSWLYRVLREGNLLGYETQEVYCLGNNISNCLSSDLDRYGDSYTEDATVESLKHTFSIIKNLHEESCLEPMINRQSVKNFVNYTAYFDKFLTVNDSNSHCIYDSLEDELEFRYYYGSVCQRIDKTTNLIITAGNSDRIALLRNYCRRDYLNIEITDKNFIYDQNNYNSSAS